MAGDTRSRAARKLSAERQRQIFELRLRGVSFEDIARQFGLSVSGAQRAYKRVLIGAPESPVTLARKEQLERLDRLRPRLWSKLGTTNEASGISLEIARAFSLTGAAVFITDKHAGLGCCSERAAELTNVDVRQLQALRLEEVSYCAELLVRLLAKESHRFNSHRESPWRLRQSSI